MQELDFDDNLKIRSQLNEFEVFKERSYANELYSKRALQNKETSAKNKKD